MSKLIDDLTYGEWQVNIPPSNICDIKSSCYGTYIGTISSSHLGDAVIVSYAKKMYELLDLIVRESQHSKDNTLMISMCQGLIDQIHLQYEHLAKAKTEQ